MINNFCENFKTISTLIIFKIILNSLNGFLGYYAGVAIVILVVSIILNLIVFFVLSKLGDFFRWSHLHFPEHLILLEWHICRVHF